MAGVKKSYESYRGSDGDEELRSVGVGSGVGHADRVWAVVAQTRVKLVLKLATPHRFTACSCA